MSGCDGHGQLRGRLGVCGELRGRPRTDASLEDGCAAASRDEPGGGALGDELVRVGIVKDEFAIAGEGRRRRGSRDPSGGRRAE